MLQSESEVSQELNFIVQDVKHIIAETMGRGGLGLGPSSRRLRELLDIWNMSSALTRQKKVERERERERELNFGGLRRCPRL
jgi:hypothetical protein